MEIIVENIAPIRLDRFLRRRYPTITQGLLEKALRSGDIKLNGKKTLSNVRLAFEDKIHISEILKLESATDQKKNFSSSVIKLAGKILNEYLIYDHPDFIAIDKPTGLATQSGTKINLSIDDALQYLTYKSERNDEFRLVHRLDKETSGVLLIATNYASSSKLGEAFKDRQIKKTYLARTQNLPPQESGEISSLIAKTRGGVFEAVEESSEGKQALTHYKLLEKIGRGALVEFKPETGRMHQIRFHAKKLGCPIIGDCKYGGAAKGSTLLLHAESIEIPASIFGKKINIRAELPEYFGL